MPYAYVYLITLKTRNLESININIALRMIYSSGLQPFLVVWTTIFLKTYEAQ